MNRCNRDNHHKNCDKKRRNLFQGKTEKKKKKSEMKSKKENNKVLGYISFIISDRKLIYKDKQAVLLTEKESDIFVSLLNSEDRGITKEEVMSKVWMLNPNIETHTFETHLYRLRKKIKEGLILNDFIISKGGRFYLNHELTGKKN